MSWQVPRRDTGDRVRLMPAPATRRRRRLAEELAESGLCLEDGNPVHELLLDEIDHALRPNVHERRVPSSGTIVEPTSDPTGWADGTRLEITRAPLAEQP